MASDTELWRGTDYGWWLAADTSGAVGASLIAFAVPLMMLATTGSSAAATTTESICVVVQTVLGLAGGVIQDRYDRRTLMLIWGASGVVLSAVAAAAVMLFGNAPKTSGHGVNGANAPAFGGPYATCFRSRCCVSSCCFRCAMACWRIRRMPCCVAWCRMSSCRTRWR